MEFIIYDSKEGIVVETSTVKTEFTLREKACLYLYPLILYLH